MSSFEEILAQDGKLIYKTKGVSMRPMLHENRDLVVIVPPEGPLKKYDVALYKRDKAYVLHRVIRVKEKGYLIRGDNTYAIEKVPGEAVIGVLTDFKRKGKTHSVNDKGYRLYVWVWCAAYPVRWFAIKIRRKLGRIVRATGILRKQGENK